MAKGYIAGLEFEPLYLIKDDSDHMLAMRFRTTSDSRANAIGQNCGREPVKLGYYNYPTKGSSYCHFIGKISGNYRTFYEGMVISEAVDNEVLFTTEGEVVADYYNFLMTNFKLPLLKEWSEYLYLESIRQSVVSVVRNAVRTTTKSADMLSMIHGDKTINLAELQVVNVAGMSEELLRTIVSNGLANNKIFLEVETHQKMNKLQVDGMDEYTVQFGPSLCENLEKEKIRPKSKTLRRSVEGLALLDRKLYAPQAACTSGIVESMFSGDKYIFVSEEMGCGKTIQSAAAVEAYYNQKWLRKNPGKTLKDCFLSGEVAYRTVVICPSHLCAKWKAEVEKQIPGAVGILVTDIAQLESMRKKDRKERNGKEFYIFSKEFAKGDTYKRPVPTKVAYRKPMVNLCYDCLEASANEVNEHHKKVLAKKEPWTRRELENSYLVRNPMYIINGVPTCICCGGHNSHLYELNYPHQIAEGKVTTQYKGLCCPSCDNLLLVPSQAVYKGNVEEFGKCVHTPASFANKTKSNESCHICGSSLWEDNVQSMNIPLRGKPTPVVEEEKVIIDENGMPRFETKEKKGWVKIKFAGDYAKLKLTDKKKRLNKSGFALRGHELETLAERGVGTEYVYTEREYGPRRYSPARFAKKYLRGYFDVMIADEAHLYEGCRTEQAIAMHCLMKTVKFSMLLTGTLTNGTASSLFNIHFMANPGRMKELGYSYDNESARLFAKKYGVVETKFALNVDSYGNYNAQGRGQQLGTPTIKPGISPMVYPELLLNNTVQLNIGDMSNHLAPLNEYVVEVDMNEDQYSGYSNNINNIRDALNTPPMGAELMGKMLQLGLSYVDKPYGRNPVWSLKVPDALIVEPMNFEQYRDAKCLLPKEEKLVEIVNKEVSEGRNVFIYTEYSGNEETDIDGRLQEIVETHCNLKGQVKVLKSKDVKATEREEYIRKHSDKIKVWITNYRNVETGIDFVGEYEGRKFNYPTIVFFQVGMSLSSVWQASRRHYRLNQTEECRTYYLVYKGTFQLDMLEMMSKKMSAASAIQGNFSESALENMAGSEDPAVVLAKKIMAGQMGGSTDVDVQAQLAKTRQSAVDACDESIYTGEEPVTYYELMGKDAGVFTTTVVVEPVVATVESVVEEVSEYAEKSDAELLSEFFNFFQAAAVVTAEDIKAVKKKSARPMIGQMALF